MEVEMDWHYHANHIDAPARGSKTAAMKDARRLHVLNAIYDGTELPEDPNGRRPNGFPEWPLIVKCFRPDCVITKAVV